MTFTISSAFIAREHAVDGLSRHMLRAVLIAVLILKPTSAFSLHGYLHGFIKHTSWGLLSRITVPSLQKAVK